MTHEPKAYRRTLFDRYGPGALDLIRSGSYGVMVFGLTFGAVALAAKGVSIATIGIAAAAGLATAGVSLLMAKGAGGFATVMTHGAGTPYEEQYSREQALVMQGKIDEALASFASYVSASPNAVQPCIRSAELYLQYKSDARRAAELLRQARRMASITPGEDVYATNRLVDLLVGPLGDPGRACVELRRLIDRYPGTATAAHARGALARVKQTLTARE
jgi:hypothetical protein